ncbi:MAG TPA: CHAT domain-containing tetratricopeptide repeat protein [Candidatus Binatia bacterium]|nr:CHAT domain-containing tetratricopeptide repeat protein [Candidatus Binatia bacterium]
MDADDTHGLEPAGGVRLLIAAILIALALSPGAAASGETSGGKTAAPADDPLSIGEIGGRLDAGDVEGAVLLAGRVPARVPGTVTTAPTDLALRLEAVALRLYEAGTHESAAAAEALFRSAVALRERAPAVDRPGQASLLHDLSGLCFNRGDYAEAERVERRALAIYEESPQALRAQAAASRRDLGYILMNEGRLAEGGRELMAALRVMESSGETDWIEQAMTRDNVAELDRLQGRYREAALVLERLVEESTQRLGESNPQVHVFMNNLAGIYKDQERFDEAQTLLNRSLALRRAAPEPDTQAIARATLNLAELCRLQGRYADAEPLYLEALDLARKAWEEESGELFEFVNQLAVLYREQRRFAEAEPLARQARDLIVRQLGPDHPRVAQSEFELGELVRASGRCREAMERYDRASDIREAALGKDHPEMAEILVARATCLASAPAGGPAAQALAGRAVGILERSDAFPGVEAEALALRADLLRKAQPARARADLARALRLIEALRPHRGGSEGVRAGFFGRQVGLFERMVRWDVEDGRIDEALLYAERVRARALLDQLVAARADGTAGADPAAAARLEGARAEVAESRQRLQYVASRTDQPAATRQRELRDLGRRLTEADRGLRQAYEEARNSSPAWRSATGVGPAAPAEWLGSVVPRDGLILLYEIGESGSFLFALPAPPGTVQVFPLTMAQADAAVLGVSAGPLQRAALDRVLLGEAGAPGLVADLAAPPGLSTRRGIGGLTGGDRSVGERLQALRNVLVPPSVWTRVSTRKEIVIVPDGSLCALPFEALVIGPGGQGGGPRYWLDAGPPLRYAPSASILREITRRVETAGPRASRGQAALSVSDPAYAPRATAPPERAAATAGRRREGGSDFLGPLERLPGTAMETRNIRAALDGTAEVTVLEGRDAREPEVRRQLPGKRFLHLATHGLVEERSGNLFAALALAPPAGGAARGEDDGLLELAEIYDLRLDCDLAVLSACRTNVGQSVAGEGIFALSRGFLVAGARRVIASQWSVDDASTAELVGQLFRGLAAADRAGSGIEYAKVLRDAKRRIRARAEWAEPFYWAPFVLTGLP